MDPPSIPCVSRERLFCARNLISFNRNTENIAFELLGVNCDVLDNIKNLLDSQNSNEAFICTKCNMKLRKNIMPSVWVLNNLHVKEVPDEIKSLNMYKQILIQRAKTF